MILNQGVRLIDRFIITDAKPTTAALSPDGSVLAIGLNDVSVRWYDTATLTDRGRMDLIDVPTSDGDTHVPVLLHFVDNHRLRVTLEWYGYVLGPAHTDSVLIDLDHARLVAPPPLFTEFRHATFSADGLYALLFNASRQMQLWHVEPWRALSPIFAQDVDTTLPYLLQSGGATVHSNGLRFELLDPHRPATGQRLALLPHDPWTAWAESGDGRKMAIGDSSGQVFLVDIAALKVRLLPIPTGEKVTFLSFSEDGAWLAVARLDGAAYAYDVVTGTPLHSGQLQHDFPLRHVALSRQNRLLIASGNGQSAIWQLPDAGPGGFAATRLTASPTRSAKASEYWAGASFGAGLMATADFDGEVRLWRLPTPALLAARAPLFSGGFDGAHIADVEYNHVRVVPPGSDEGTPWVALPEPIAFAGFAAEGRLLVTAAGPALHVFDTASMSERSTVELPANPMQFAVDAHGETATLAFGENGASGYREGIARFDLATGRQLPASASVAGPLRQFELSADDSQLLSVGPASGATEVFDTASLRRIGVHPHDAERPVLRASYAADSSLWLVTRSVDEQEADNAGLLHWNPAGASIFEQRAIAGLWPIGVAALGGIPLLAAKDRLVLDPGTAQARTSPMLALGEATTVFAISHDRRLIAHAFGRDVYVYDAETMAPLGAPLHTNMGMLDIVLALAFAPDDASLLCETGQRKYFLWRLSADRRPVEDLRAEASLLVTSSPHPGVLLAAGTAERQRLRRSDPGAWRQAAPRPPVRAAREVAGVPIPQRPAQLDPLLLDLTDYYTSAPDSEYNITGSVVPTLRGLPLGTTRIEGVDYDVRGALELRWGEPAGLGRDLKVVVRNAARGIKVPARPIAAFRPLIHAGIALPVKDERNYAYLRIHYHDGSESELPIRTNREVSGSPDGASPAPIAWDYGRDLDLLGILAMRAMNNPRLPNPHPERLVDSIDIEASEETFSAFAVFAITAEPVIATADSRSQPATLKQKNRKPTE
jgi:WD40 repeat protein